MPWEWEERDSSRPFAAEGFMCLYSVSKERRSYSLQSTCVTRGQRYSVDLRQGSVKVELQYSAIIFRGSNFSWCFNFRG